MELYNMLTLFIKALCIQAWPRISKNADTGAEICIAKIQKMRSKYIVLEKTFLSYIFALHMAPFWMRLEKLRNMMKHQCFYE